MIFGASRFEEDRVEALLTEEWLDVGESWDTQCRSMFKCESGLKTAWRLQEDGGRICIYLYGNKAVAKFYTTLFDCH